MEAVDHWEPKPNRWVVLLVENRNRNKKQLGIISLADTRQFPETGLVLLSEKPNGERGAGNVPRKKPDRNDGSGNPEGVLEFSMADQIGG